MKIIASLVLYKHQYKDIKQTLVSLFEEISITKVVIVDNGTHCAWLDDFSHEKLDVIKLPDNRGFGAGHNVVFDRYANTTQYILICNPDIVFARGEIDKLYHFMLSNEVGLSIPKVIYPDGRMQYGCKLLPAPFQLFKRRFISNSADSINEDYELRLADYSKPFFAPSLSGCFMLISRDVLRDVHGFDPRFFMYLEDVDLSRRVSSTSHKVSYCPDSLVVHESQRNSYVDLRFMLYHIVSAIRYFNKWGWIFDQQRKRLNRSCLEKLPLAAAK